MASDRWDQIEKLYHAALERPESERSAFLEQVCDGDEELRREVMSLLAQTDTNGNLLEIPALEVAAKMLNPNQAESLIGKRLGSYEILSAIGAGGMGEVYRAKDTKLGREVAIKVLPQQFALDSERLARFRREAKLLASLNHPNIATIHGLEEAGGIHFLVMELVSGETLQERVGKKGAVPLDESLEIAKQICEALEHAHEKGIIHRDLKPANVKLTAERKIKVLDFGLAKAFAADSADNALDSNISTVPPTASPTTPGMILGTAAYMSPEQARGNPVDRRTDIWAFGCVLYELLTGKQAFTGETVTDILGAVMRAEPDWSALPEATPPAIRALLRRCLQKDASKRSRDAAEIRIQLDEIRSTGAIFAASSGPATAKRSHWNAIVIGVACLLIGGILTTYLIRTSMRPTPPQRMAHFLIALPEGDSIGGTGNGSGGSAIAVDPEGKRVAYVSTSRTGVRQIYLRNLDEVEGKPVTGTESGTDPFFSPDGQWIGFFTSDSTKKVSVNGGIPVMIADTASQYERGASWGTNGTIAISSNISASLFQISADGGEKRPLTTLKRGEVRQNWPQLLPGGKALLFSSQLTSLVGTSSDSSFQIVVQRLDTEERKTLIQGGIYPRYVPTGHLLFVRSGTLMAVRFDLSSLNVVGEAVPVVENVQANSGTGSALFGVSDTGVLAYVAGGPQDKKSNLVRLDRKGVGEPLKVGPQFFANPRFSPDGQQLAVIISIPKPDVWTYNLGRDTLTRLTFEGINTQEMWSRDGKRVAYASARGGAPASLFWRPVDGSGAEERLTTAEYIQFPGSFTPDGQTLLFSEAGPQSGRDIWMISLAGDRKPRPFLRTPFNETVARISPDGRYVAYLSDESGRNEVYVQPFPGPGGKYQISTEGAREMVWGANGELFYRNGAKMIAVEIKTQPTLEVGKPKVLFEGNYEMTGGGVGNNYDVTPDGQHFIMVKSNTQPTSAAQIHVVLNWFEELKQKVPVK